MRPARGSAAAQNMIDRRRVSCPRADAHDWRGSSTCPIVGRPLQPPPMDLPAFSGKAVLVRVSAVLAVCPVVMMTACSPADPSS